MWLILLHSMNLEAIKEGKAYAQLLLAQKKCTNMVIMVFQILTIRLFWYLVVAITDFFNL